MVTPCLDLLDWDELDRNQCTASRGFKGDETETGFAMTPFNILNLTDHRVGSENQRLIVMLLYHEQYATGFA